MNPDQTIAYSTNRSGTGKTEIWLVDVDGGDPRQLTRSGPNHEPAWSPDGKRIAFQSTRDGHYEIYVSNVDGTGLQRLTTSTGYANDEPAWSPDGKQIAVDWANSPSDPNTIIWATSKARASWVYETPARSKRFVVAGGGAASYEFRARMSQFDRGGDTTIGFSPTLTVELK